MGEEYSVIKTPSTMRVGFFIAHLPRAKFFDREKHGWVNTYRPTTCTFDTYEEAVDTIMYYGLSYSGVQKIYLPAYSTDVKKRRRSVLKGC